MPFDVFGWSPNTERGFGGYQSGNRFANIYGYDNGQAISNRQQWQQIEQQRNAPPSAPKPGVGGDFFSQLAGLIGGGMGQQKPVVNPNIPQQKPFNPGQAISQPGSQYRQVITPGGIGPYGGVSPEGQRKMFEGNARAWGQWQQRGGGMNTSRSTVPPFGFGKPRPRIWSEEIPGSGGGFR